MGACKIRYASRMSASGSPRIIKGAGGVKVDYGRNLTNEAVLNQGLTSALGDVAVYEPRRTYGVSISKEF